MDVTDAGLYQAFVTEIKNLHAAHCYDILLDFGSSSGPVDILASRKLGARWARVAEGRDVGRRTAIVSRDPEIAARLEGFRAIYPYRVIEMFESKDMAIDWIENATSSGSHRIQYL